MVSKLIQNAGQAFSLGGTWGNPPIENTTTTEFAFLINNTATTLYVGDIVVLDATGTLANLSSSAGDPTVIGCVGEGVDGGWLNNAPTLPYYDSQIGFNPSTGSIIPQSDAAQTTAATIGFTNGSATATYTASVKNDLGRTIVTPYNSSTNATPQIFTIIAVNAGTGYTVSANFTGTTGSFVCQLLDSPVSAGPGYPAPLGGSWTSSSTFAPGAVVPIITRGFGRVNISAASGVVAKGNIAVGNGVVSGTYVANASGVVGQNIAVALEAYAARDTTLTTAGITGHDSVRAIIGKF
jgi:hypothetical protein